MKLFREQRKSIFKANKRINLWHGPVRSGKSVAVDLAFLNHVRAGPRGEMYMIGKTVFTLRRNVIGPMLEMLGPDMRYRKSEGMINLWGRTIHVLGANDERAEERVRGSTSAGTLGDEVSLWPNGYFPMVTSRMSVEGARFYGSTNPDNPNHWLKTDYLDRAKEMDLKAFHWPLDSNVFLPDEYIQAIKREYTGLWKRRFIDGEWVLAEGAVYDMFNEEIHAITESPYPANEYIVGVDYGTGNPTVFILFGIYFPPMRRPIVWAEREYYYDSKKHSRQKTDSEYATDMVNFLASRENPKTPISAIYVDPSALSFKVELKDKGIYEVEDADNDVANGIRTVSTMLHQRRYFVNSLTCPNTIREYGGYVWDPKKAAKGEDAPVKQNDHAKDAERYALHSRFGQDRIEYSMAGMKW
jgi:PBSX family phage terminase large subunit